MFVQQLINGITLGSIYSLIALGYTLVYGILLMINFAHSEIFMLGAYFGFIVVAGLIRFTGESLSPWILLPVSFVSAWLGSSLTAVLMERVAYRPLRRAPRLAPLISAVGVSILLQNVVMLFQSSSIPFPDIFPGRTHEFLGVSYSDMQIFIIVLSVLLMIGLEYVVSKTRLGKAMRATSEDRDVARLMGVNANRVISFTFFLGGGLGGVAGVLSAMYYGSMKYNMGFLPGIKAFTAAVMGGIGNITGAMIGGLVLGVVESLGAGYISSDYKDVFAFVILIIVLIVKPSGILGRHTAEKV